MRNGKELELLEKFILNNPELEKLENLLARFNIFETLDIVNAEIRHSNVLSWLLNPNANHGLGDCFVKLLLKYIVSKNKDYLDNKISLFDFESFNYSNLEIRREWEKIDILLILARKRKKYVIAIENKITTSEHSKQLQRYRKIIENEFKNYNKIYVFLTPEGIIPSDENWITFSYTIISNLLDDLLNNKKDTLGANVLNFISQYNIILRRYIVGNSEIEQICRQIYKKHQQALDIIFQYKPDLDLEVSEYLQECLKKNENIILEGAGKTIIRFTSLVLDNLIKKISEGWSSSKRILLFEFSNYQKRLALRLYIGPGEQGYRTRLIEFFKKDPALFKLAVRTFGKKWHAVYQKEFLRKKDYENSTMDDLKPLIDKKLSEFLNEDLVKINTCFEKNWAKI